jgi:serine/threonine protein kinase
MDVPFSEQPPAVFLHDDDNVLSVQEDTPASGLEAANKLTAESPVSDEQEVAAHHMKSAQVASDIDLRNSDAKEPPEQHERSFGWYTFTWEHFAKEVFVTGSFDNWTKSVRLINEGSIFKKEVMLPKVSIMYKFVVDGNWMVNPALRTKAFGGGLVNNVLASEDIIYNQWTMIREKAARRTAQVNKQGSWPQYSWQQGLMQESDKDRNLKRRVDEIRARVAELTSDDVVPASKLMDGILSQAAENSDRKPKFHTPPPQTHKGGLANDPPDGDVETQAMKETTSVNPKLDHILSNINDETARDTFQSHGISDLWLPIPRQTLRRLIGNNDKEKAFMDAQDEMIDSKLQVLSQTTGYGHATIDDDEELVQELRVLGEGACGIVEEVSIMTESGTTNCVRKRIGRPKQLKSQKSILAAFVREVGVMRRVSHHHFVQFLGSYTDIEHVNILSSPVADMDLATFLDHPILNKEREILYRGLGCLCNAIHYLHQNNIRHEDLKPQNVLIHGNNILLTDFGFSLDFSENSVSTTTGRPAAWTIRYSAPEVLEFEPRNRASDIYSLGCVLFEMVAGFYGTSLSDLKAYWKRTGNGHPSFARNSKALETSYQHHFPIGHTHRYDKSKIKHFRRWIRLMLNDNKILRPTSTQIIDGLLDIRLLVYPSLDLYNATCEGLPACTGLAQSTETMQGSEFRSWQLKYYPDLDRYMYPWLDKDFAYSLWDLDFNFNASINKHDKPFGLFSQPWVPGQSIRDACSPLYHEACRTGTTKMFWDAHTKEAGHPIPEDFKEHAQVSAHTLSIKHVVFKMLPVKLTSSPELCGLAHVVCATLLPICLPRSPLYGTFFWMLSWSTDNTLNDEFAKDHVVDFTTVF